eukprot:6492375-Amphidinium_carterae.2
MGATTGERKVLKHHEGEFARQPADLGTKCHSLERSCALREMVGLRLKTEEGAEGLAAGVSQASASSMDMNWKKLAPVIGSMLVRDAEANTHTHRKSSL